VKYGELATQIEANVAESYAATSISTAWNERALVIDLYDLYFLYTMVRAMPDMAVLEKRLRKVASTPRNKNPRQMSLQQLISKLRARLAGLSADDMIELSDYLPSDELQGLELKIRTQLLQFCDAAERRMASR